MITKNKPKSTVLLGNLGYRAGYGEGYKAGYNQKVALDSTHFGIVLDSVHFNKGYQAGYHDGTTKRDSQEKS